MFSVVENLRIADIFDVLNQNDPDRRTAQQLSRVPTDELCLTATSS